MVRYELNEFDLYLRQVGTARAFLALAPPIFLIIGNKSDKFSVQDKVIAPTKSRSAAETAEPPELFEGAPEAGLGVHWDVPTAADLGGKPPEAFLAEVSRLFGACVRKFEPYMDARQILVIEQHGDMRYMGVWWWKRVLDA